MWHIYKRKILSMERVFLISVELLLCMYAQENQWCVSNDDGTNQWWSLWRRPYFSIVIIFVLEVVDVRGQLLCLKSGRWCVGLSILIFLGFFGQSNWHRFQLLRCWKSLVARPGSWAQAAAHHSFLTYNLTTEWPLRNLQSWFKCMSLRTKAS